MNFCELVSQPKIVEVVRAKAKEVRVCRFSEQRICSLALAIRVGCCDHIFVLWCCGLNAECIHFKSQGAVIVYCHKKESCDMVHSWLCGVAELGFSKVAAYHGDVSSSVMERWTSKELRVVVATVRLWLFALNCLTLS